MKGALMKCLAVLLGLVVFTSANPGISFSYSNPAGVTYFGSAAVPAVKTAAVAAPAVAAPAYAAPVVAAPAYAARAVAAPAYAAPALVAPRVAVPAARAVAAPAIAPAVAVQQHVGYAKSQVLTSVPGVADVPVTKLAYSKGYTQKQVDVAHPAVATRKIKVRRPALRKEFYDIEHRVVVRPAGSATLELSNPVSKEQKGPTVLTPTNYQPLAPVVRYGNSRRIIDGDQVSQISAQRVALSRGAPAPAPQLQQAPAPAPQPQAAPAPQPQAAPAPQPQAAPAPQPAPEVRAARPSSPLVLTPEPRAPAPGPNAPAPQPQDAPSPRSQDDAIVVGDQPQQGAQAQPGQLTITPDMPAELQTRLLQLLTAKNGAVTEVLGEDGKPADSANVLAVADSLRGLDLQGGERVTTRRIVVTRPIETVQEVEIQEPAKKIHRVAVNTPTLFKHHIPAVARVPVNVPAVKNFATPVVKTTYAAAPAPIVYHK